MNNFDYSNLSFGNIVTIKEIKSVQFEVFFIVEKESDKVTLQNWYNEIYIYERQGIFYKKDDGFKKDKFNYVYYDIDFYSQEKIDTFLQEIEEIKELSLYNKIYSIRKFESGLKELQEDKEKIDTYLQKRKEFIQEYENCTKMFLFEIETFNTKNNEDDYCLYEIEFDFINGELWSHSINDNTENLRLTIDYDFNLTSNLEEFYDLCINDILSSKNYTLRYD